MKSWAILPDLRGDSAEGWLVSSQTPSQTKVFWGSTFSHRDSNINWQKLPLCSILCPMSYIFFLSPNPKGQTNGQHRARDLDNTCRATFSHPKSEPYLPLGASVLQISRLLLLTAFSRSYNFDVHWLFFTAVTDEVLTWTQPDKLSECCSVIYSCWSTHNERQKWKASKMSQ